MCCIFSLQWILFVCFLLSRSNNFLIIKTNNLQTSYLLKLVKMLCHLLHNNLKFWITWKHLPDLYDLNNSFKCFQGVIGVSYWRRHDRENYRILGIANSDTCWRQSNHIFFYHFMSLKLTTLGYDKTHYAASYAQSISNRNLEMHWHSKETGRFFRFNYLSYSLNCYLTQSSKR